MTTPPPYGFTDLVAQCNLCGRSSIADAIGDKCGMPQPTGQTCLGMFEDTRQEDVTSNVVFTIMGTPVSAGTMRHLPRGKELSRPKVILSKRAKEIARKAFRDSDKSLEAAIVAVAGVIVADNLVIIAEGADASSELLTVFGRTIDAEVCAAYTAMLRNYVEAFDPDRPAES